MNSELILFGIDAGVRLGQKLNDVLVDETFERPLMLPVGELFGDVREDDAIDFFDQHPELTAAGAAYHGLNRADRLKAYQTLLQIDARVVGSGGVAPEAIRIVANLQKFRQYEQGFGARPALQRVVGTLVEIGIDYFVAHPEAIGAKSNQRKILQAFIESLDEAELAEGSFDAILGDVVVSVLDTLQSNTALVADDQRTQALLGGITGSLLSDIRAAGSPAQMLKREDFVRRVASSILRGGTQAFSENLDLFVRNDPATQQLVGSTLTHLLAGIKGKEDLFTNESLEILFDSALRGVAEHADIFTGNAVLQELISSTLTVLTDATGKKVFAPETVSAVLANALAVAAENVETLIDVNNPQKQLLANAAKAVAQSLGGALAGGGTVKDLLSRQQLLSLMSVVFDEVAMHPEQLLGESAPGDRKAALAQVIGSVASALGDEPARFVTGEGFVSLVEIALRTAVKNPDKLLNLDTVKTENNVLFQVIEQTVAAVTETGDPRKLVSREVFLQIADHLLPAVSANIAGLEHSAQAVQDAVGKALELAQGPLEGRINGDNLPALITELLTQVLWQELDLTENAAVIRTATLALKAA